MRHIIIPLLTAVLVASCMTAEATPPPDKPVATLGYVDLSRVMKDSETVKKAGAALQADIAKWNQEIATADAEAKKAEADKKATAAEKKAKRDAATAVFQRHQGEKERRIADEDAKLARAVDEAAAAVGAERGVDVLPVRALYARAGLDLTAEVVKRLDVPPADGKVAALEKRIKELEASRKP